VDIKMFRAALLGTALCAAVASAPGAWASEPTAGGQPFSWTGFYAGLSIGHAWDSGGSVGLLTDQAAAPFLFQLGGEAGGPSHGTIGDLGRNWLFGGAQIGWNWRSGLIVYGIEADIQGGQKDSIAGTFSSPDDLRPISGVATLDLDWYATVRGRLGVLASPSLLIYATGGWAVGQVDYSLSASETGGFALLEAKLRSSGTESGYTVGGGIETALSRNLSLKIEYQYVNLGSVDASGPVTFIGDRPSGETATTSQTIDFHTVRAGLNVHW
jgi:outer membrane immunogenic protein